MGYPHFEYDEHKSCTNHDKHGIDFDEAIELWGDSQLVCLRSKVETDEERLLFIGRIKAKYWTAIATHRGEKLRIISVRRARKKEIQFYESERY